MTAEGERKSFFFLNNLRKRGRRKKGGICNTLYVVGLRHERQELVGITDIIIIITILSFCVEY